MQVADGDDRNCMEYCDFHVTFSGLDYATNTTRPSKSNQAKWNEGQRGQMVLTLQERGEELSYPSYTHYCIYIRDAL